tara:strand:+ start:772 stop:981 length:210 start_codon:yes stop_codon:yes gene_type:complete
MANKREKAIDEESGEDSPKSVVNQEEIKIDIPEEKPAPVKIDISKIKFKADGPASNAAAGPKIKLIKPS